MIIREKVVTVKDPDGVLGWLLEHCPTLFNILFLEDETWSAILFGDTSPETISWHIAVAARDGNVFAKMACEMLNLLSSNHCLHALENGA